MSIRPFIWLLAFVLLLLPLHAVADACQSGITLDNLVRTGGPATVNSCTIGSLIFTFGDFDSAVLAPSQILFTPDPSDPSSLGFILTPIPGSTFSAFGTGAQSVFQFSIGYFVTPDTVSEILLSGARATANGVEGNVNGIDPSNNNRIRNIFQTAPGACGGFQGTADATLHINAVGANDISQPFRYTSGVCLAESTRSGQAFLKLTSVDSATVSVESAGYYVNTNAAPTPEPSALLLLGSGLAGLAIRLRRRK